MADEVESGKRGVPPGLVVSGLLAALLIVFIVQNTNEVPVTLFFWEFTGPLWLVLAVTVLVGLLIFELATTIMRRRKKK